MSSVQREKEASEREPRCFYNSLTFSCTCDLTSNTPGLHALFISLTHLTSSVVFDTTVLLVTHPLGLCLTDPIRTHPPPHPRTPTLPQAVSPFKQVRELALHDLCDSGRLIDPEGQASDITRMGEQIVLL